jgi:hypothetical protein
MSRPHKAVFEVSPEIIEWLNHNLTPLEQQVFMHYRGVQRLVRLVDQVEEGRLPKYAALSALRDYNEEHKSCVTYEEIRDRSPNYIFSDIGDWVAYLDNPYATNLVISGDYDEPSKAFENAHPDICWIVLWLPSENVVVVYRSPYQALRRPLNTDEFEENLSDGLEPGTTPTYTFPPSLLAAINTVDPEEVLYHQPRWS